MERCDEMRLGKAALLAARFARHWRLDLARARALVAGESGQRRGQDEREQDVSSGRVA